MVHGLELWKNDLIGRLMFHEFSCIWIVWTRDLKTNTIEKNEQMLCSTDNWCDSVLGYKNLVFSSDLQVKISWWKKQTNRKNIRSHPEIPGGIVITSVTMATFSFILRCLYSDSSDFKHY